jgi:hypothetical protein
MKRKKKVVLGIISLVVIFGLSYAIYEWKVTQNFAKGIFGPGKITAVNLDGWEKMRVGMTQEEVIKLLGDSSSKRKFTVSGDNFSSTQRFWEYNYKSGILQSPDPRAYVVFFDSKGIVTSFRAPLNDNSNTR